MEKEKIKAEELKGFRNRVEKKNFEYEEEVRDFTGLIFHCPNCDEVFHLHIASVKIIPKKVIGDK